MTPISAGTAAPLSNAGFNAVLAQLQVEAPALWSLIAVETSGFGYLDDRRPKILFERHIFHRRTNGRFDATHPDISSADAGGYVGGVGEYRRVEQAMTLDRRNALESASWGLGQIMGFNAASLGYAGVEDMVTRFSDSEDQQLQGSLQFILRNQPLASAFRTKQWKKVAFFYNGSAYAQRRYDEKLRNFFEVYRLKGVPDIDVRAAQARLTYLGYAPGGVDGITGHRTQAATMAFQQKRGLAVTGELDAATLQALQESANA